MRHSNTGSILQRGIALLFFISFIFFTACEEDGLGTTINFQEGEESAFQSEESTENAFDVIESITSSAIQLAQANAGGRIAESTDPEFACAQVSFTGTLASGRLEINFGEGCEGPGGKIRKGIVVVEYEGHWLEHNAKVWTILKDFYLDDIKIEGTRILTNVSLTAEAFVFDVEIVNGKILWPDGTFLTRTCNRTQTLKFGNTLDDFELHIDGTASGVTRLGVEYTTEIVEPLIFKSSCRGNTIYLPVAGVKSITIPEKREITINYGDSACDNKIVISVGDERAERTI